MGGHTGVQRTVPGAEVGLFSVVCPLNVAHVLRHGVPVVVGGSEGVLGHHPPRREDHEVAQSGALFVGGGCQHCEDGGVGVVVQDGVLWTEEG